MSAEVAFVRAWRVGRFRAILSCPKPRPGVIGSAVIEWEPSIPHRLTKAELAEYRAGRAVALADLSRELNVSVTVIDL